MVNIWSFFTQIIGSRCPLCGQPADGLCGRCVDALPRNHSPCPRCALPLPEGVTDNTLCAACQRRPPVFDRAIAPLLYRAPVDDLISGFKYHGRLELGRVLCGLLSEGLEDSPTRPEQLIPVPMHPRKLRQRGFNQSAEISRGLGRHLGIPDSPGSLRRLVDGSHQRGLSRQQRLRNIRGVFGLNSRLPTRVALIDDVITTGATAEAISQLMKEAGVESVEIWAIARTPRDR